MFSGLNPLRKFYIIVLGYYLFFLTIVSLITILSLKFLPALIWKVEILFFIVYIVKFILSDLYRYFGIGIKPQVYHVKIGIGKKKLRCVCISDTHNIGNAKLFRGLPKGDVLISAGDISLNGQRKGVEDFIKHWRSEKVRKGFKYKIFVPGNHDKIFDEKLNDENESRLRKRFVQDLNDSENGYYYLENQKIEIDGIVVYGTPLCLCPSKGMAFSFRSDRSKELKRVIEAIPVDCDILISHGPPHGILDTVFLFHKHAGSKLLRERVRTVKPRAHVFGHLHESFGIKGDGSTTFVNCSKSTLLYGLRDETITFDYLYEES